MFAGRNMMFVMGTASTPPPSGTIIFPSVYEQSTIADIIRWKIDGTMTHEAAASGVIGTAVTHTATGQDYNTEFELQVVSANEAGESSILYDPVTYFTAPEFAPVLSAEVLSSTSIRLTWTAASVPINGGFSVYRKTGVVEAVEIFTLLETVAAPGLTFDVTGLTASSEEKFKVESHNNNASPILSTSAGFSNTVTATTESVPLGWESQYEIASGLDAVISTEGVLVQAVTLGRPSAEGVRTVNGVPFTSLLTYGSLIYNDQNNSYFVATGHSGAETNLDIMLRAVAYGGDGMVPLTGLEIGETYRLQVLCAAEASTPYLVNYSLLGYESSVLAKPAYSRCCVFVATATTEYLFCDWFLAAFQVRKLS